MSPLEQDLEDYLHLRHALGHDLADAGRVLPSLVAHLQAHGLRTVTVETALAWAQHSPTGTSVSGLSRRMTAARGFVRYLAGIEPDPQVPPLGLIPSRQRWRPPFIYTPHRHRRDHRLGPGLDRAPLRAATYQTLIGLLAATGLRIGEAIKLDRGDIDWDQEVLLIRESKGSWPHPGAATSSRHPGANSG